MTSEAGNPWERQPSETDKAYAAFCLHRDTPPTLRNLRELSIQLYGHEVTYVRRWSSTYQWAARVVAWDEHLDEITRAAVEEERADAAKDRVVAAREGVKLFKAWVDSAKGQVANLPAGMMPSLLKTCSDLARLEDGESTGRVEGVLSWKELMESVGGN